MGDESNSGRVTRLLAAMRDGRCDAGDELLALVYEHLRAMARRQMARAPAADTLEPTALVHEAYIRHGQGGSRLAEPPPLLCFGGEVHA